MNARLSFAAIPLIAIAGCETSGANTVAGIGDVPPAAVSACSMAADNLWSAAPGTSVVNSAQTAVTSVAGNWQLQMGTGSHRSACVVNPIGRVVSIAPG
jgi:hypothetical protein